MIELSHEVLENEWKYLEGNRKEGLSSKSLPFKTRNDIRLGLDDSLHILVKSEGHAEENMLKWLMV